MNALDESRLLLYLISDDIDYPAVKKLNINDLYLSLANYQDQLETMQYIMSIMREQYFEKAMFNQKTSIRDISTQILCY